MQRTKEPLVPYSAVKWLRDLGDPMKSRAYEHLERLIQATGCEVLRLEDIQGAISHAFDQHLKDSRMDPDWNACQGALDDYRAGKWKDAQDIVNELQSACA